MPPYVEGSSSAHLADMEPKTMQTNWEQSLKGLDKKRVGVEKWKGYFLRQQGSRLCPLIKPKKETAEMSALATSRVLNFGFTSRSGKMQSLKGHAVQIGHIKQVLQSSTLYKSILHMSTVCWHESHAGDRPGRLLETMKTAYRTQKKKVVALTFKG